MAARHDKLPAAKGKLPKFAWIADFARRWCIRRNIRRSPMTPTVLGNPDINLPNNQNAPNWGDPLGHSLNDSMGNGHGNGVGNGNGNGVGPGEGYGTGGGTPNAGTGGYGTPACLYCPRADYSDEAMKVKVQGVVELIAVITRGWPRDRHSRGEGPRAWPGRKGHRSGPHMASEAGAWSGWQASCRAADHRSTFQLYLTPARHA